MRESSIKDKLATVERELHEFKTQYDYMRSSLHGASQEISGTSLYFYRKYFEFLIKGVDGRYRV